jgi:hypothetical protein
MLSSGTIDSLIRWLRLKEASKVEEDGDVGEGTPLLLADHNKKDRSSTTVSGGVESAVKERIVMATAALCCTSTIIRIIIVLCA